MKTFSLLIALLAVAVISPFRASANPVKVLQAVGKVVSNPKLWKWLAAFGGSAATLKAMDSYLKEGEAVYAVGIDLNNDASSVKWADLFSKPDIFPVMMAAGMGTYIVPEICQEYAGGKVIWTFKIPRIPDGTDVALFIIDDDSSSDQVWKQIAANKWNVRIDTHINLLQAWNCSFHSNGSIQLDVSNITIDSSDIVASYSVKTPKWYLGGEWNTEGDLKDSRGRIVGHIGLSQLLKKQ